MQTCTEYWKIIVSRASGIWGDYYLTNIFLLSKYIKSVSKQLWFAAAICIMHNPLASYFNKWENTDFYFFLFYFFFSRSKDTNALRPETGTDNVIPGCFLHSTGCFTIKKTSPSFHRRSWPQKHIRYDQNNRFGLSSQLDCGKSSSGLHHRLPQTALVK